MDITYLGHSSFRIKGKSTVVVTDPYASDHVGLKFPKHVVADIVTTSHNHPDHAEISQIEGTPYVVHGPGEYDIKGVGVIGFSTFHDEEKGAKRGKNTVFRIEIDGVNIVHLGDLGHPLTAQQVDDLDGVDILMVPVGGVYTITSTQAIAIINEIEPSIVIPMHYGRPELEAKSFGELTTVQAFLKELGKEDVVPQAKLSISRDKLPETMQVVVLE